jgi:aarF domain-containing kinase
MIGRIGNSPTEKHYVTLTGRCQDPRHHCRTSESCRPHRQRFPPPPPPSRRTCCSDSPAMPIRSPRSPRTAMSTAAVFSRFCGRAALRVRVPRLPTNAIASSRFRTFRSWQRPRGRDIPRPAPFVRITLFSAVRGAALGAAAFVELSQQENDDAEETSELRMLQVSRDEIKKKVPEEDTGLARITKTLVLFLDIYIWEPVCTGFRLLHLAVLFVPVLAAVPAIWAGKRHPDRGNERSGTLWWYGLLVRAMERAGPAFIKV